MKFAKQLLLIAMSYGGVVQAQEHVHGAGSVFVIQEGRTWQVQYVLPAADALGFEHAPEDKQEHARLANLAETLKNIENLMLLGGKGSDKTCKQIANSDNLDEFAPLEAEHKHDSHHEDEHEEHKEDAHHKEEQNEHKDHEDHEEEHEEEHEVHHQNIEASYTLECSSGVTDLSFSIFEKMHSLQRLEVQWSVNLGQGSAVLSKDLTELELK